MIVLSLLRIKHWVKNLIVFLPLFFTGGFLNHNLLIRLCLGVISFSLLASAVYIFNDLCDLKEDRLHPSNKHRPLASGSVNPAWAIVTMLGLLSLSYSIAFLGFNVYALLLMTIYLIINVLYSLKIKDIPILEVFFIAFGFAIRVIFGGLISEAIASKWLVLMIFLLALFIGFGKRRSDLLLTNHQTIERKSLNGYNVKFVDTIIVLTLGIAFICYIIYTVSTDVIDRLGSNHVYLSSIFVLYGSMRYLQRLYVFDEGLSPTEIFWKDRHIQVSIASWLAFYVYLIYW